MTVSPSTATTTPAAPGGGNGGGGGGGGEEVEVLGEQVSTGPVVQGQQETVPTAINAGLTQDGSDRNAALPLGLATLGGLLGLLALVLRRRHA